MHQFLFVFFATTGVMHYNEKDAAFKIDCFGFFLLHNNKSS